MSEELDIACPFCGERKGYLVRGAYSLWRVSCSHCGARTGGETSKGKVVRLWRRLTSLEGEIARRERDVFELTPGGSEFVGEWKTCIRFVKERLATFGKVAAERNRLRDENKRLRSDIERNVQGEWMRTIKQEVK